ncbi:MAG: hypothetical protein GY756_25725 [bacterium]|nr:hypothetical protein [bacterium]
MSITVKKFITSFILLVVFLSPLSLQFNTNSFSKAEEPTISVVNNTAYALSVPCKGGWFNFLDKTACGIGNFFLTYFELLWFYTTQILVVLVGLMFDAFLFFSIDSQFYRSGMIEAGWEILRDFTNIAFIFALLIQAFQMVLGLNLPKARNKLIKIMLVALVINFSLFVSYAIIDASNILAHTFYNKIDAGEARNYNLSDGQSVEGGSGNETGTVVTDLTRDFLGTIGADTRSVSLAIAGNINPQKIVTTSGTTNFGQAYIVVFMSGLMNLLLIYLFVSIMFLFVGRTLALMIYSILAPVAFVSILIPGLENNKYIGLGNWFKQLFSLAFMAPIFLFFMYIVVTFINSKAVLESLTSPGQGFFAGIMSVFMLFFMVGGLLYFSKKIATDMAGELGGILSKAIMGTVGAAVAVGTIAATGGASLAAGGLGRIGTSAVGRKIGLGGAGKKLRSASRLIGSTKFDVTKIPGFKSIAGDKVTKAVGTVSGRSFLGQISAAKTGVQKSKGNMLGIETDKIGKEKVARAKDKAQRAKDKGKSASDWQREVKKHQDAEIQNKVVAKTQKTLDETTIAGLSADDAREFERKAYRGKVDNPEAVKKEEKELKKLNEELSNLTATLNSAKATGNPAQISVAESNVDAQKVRLDARKKGRDISKTDAQDIILTTGGGSIGFIKTSTGATYTSKGAHADNFKSEHEHQRKWIQEEETKIIQSEITKLRSKAASASNEDDRNKFNNEATLLAKKIKDMITDSERDDKKGTLDKK